MSSFLVFISYSILLINIFFQSKDSLKILHWIMGILVMTLGENTEFIDGHVIFLSSILQNSCSHSMHKCFFLCCFKNIRILQTSHRMKNSFLVDSTHGQANHDHRLHSFLEQNSLSESLVLEETNWGLSWRIDLKNWVYIGKPNKMIQEVLIFLLHFFPL